MGQLVNGQTPLTSLKLYCLTCDEYRKTQIMDPQFKQLQKENKDLEISYVKGIVPEDLINVIDCLYSYKDIPDEANSVNRKKLRPSEIAISLSFYKITQEFYRSGDYLCIICEDDIVFLNQNICTSVTEYLENTGFSLEPTITNITSTECKIRPFINARPYIFYGCYIERLTQQDFTRLSTECIFRRSQARYGNPLFVINRRFAEIILRDFFPIKYAFDDYLSSIINRYKIRAFRAVPMLAYELSSDYYKAFYTQNDLIHKKSLERRSVIGYEMPKNISLSPYGATSLTRYLVAKYVIPDFKVVKARNYYLIINEALDTLISLDDTTEHVAEPTTDYVREKEPKNPIICGSGVLEPSLFRKSKIPDAVANLAIVLSVRGPYTRKLLLEKKIYCPIRFGDPLLLISCLYKKPNNYNPKDKKKTMRKEIVAVICKEREFQKIISYLYKLSDAIKYDFIFVKINTNKIEDTINSILLTTYVVSTLLQGIIIAHSYNKKALWVSTMDLKYDEKFRFMDYYAGLRMISEHPSDNHDPKHILEPIYLQRNPDLNLNDLLAKSFNPSPGELIKTINQVIFNNPLFSSYLPLEK